MVFASLEFLTLFLPVFLLFYSIAPKSTRNGVLMLFSWIFYGWWSPGFLALLVGLTALGWIGALAISRNENSPGFRKGILVVLLTINLGLLCWYKYANIVVENINDVLGVAGAMPLHWQRVILPIGLSFIVLQGISYLVDVYRGTVRPARHFIDFAAYKAMFGQLIAGPIIRYAWVDHDLLDRGFTWHNFVKGTRRFMVGMCMKVLVADTLSPIVDVAFALPDPSFSDAWVGCLAYSLQLLFDFAGYSAMAIGLGTMLGFHFPENFDNPYIARSIQDFWRRWHLSLSTWIRDYLYIPLGGNRKGELRTYINLLLTMALAGLWHGSDSWNFLLWGLAHGIAQCVQRLWANAGYLSLPRWAGHILTLVFVCLAWTLFRAPTWSVATTMYAGQFGFNGLALGDVMRSELRPVHWLAAGLGIAAILWPVISARWALLRNPWMLAVAQLWPLPAFLLCFALIASRGAVPFLYFQF
jgi:alginate O-acetyltransferase complex protein AlgI